MKYKVFVLSLAVLFVTLISCQDDDTPFGTVLAPSNLAAIAEVADDLSGNVSVTPSADFAITYHVYFKAEADPVVISPGESANYRYTDTGEYSQEIVVIAYGRGGSASSISLSIDLNVNGMLFN